jgi:hypothetical protein
VIEHGAVEPTRPVAACSRRERRVAYERAGAMLSSGLRQRTLEGSTVGRATVRREHVLDRELE